MLRVLNSDLCAAGLGLPPAQEISNTLRAAECGVGARVFEVLPEVPAMVLEYLPGRTLGAADVRSRDLVPAIAGAVRRLHGGPAFANPFSVPAKLRELLAICRRHELPIPDGYLERLSIVERIGDQLEADRARLVPCHNDLLPANMVQSGRAVRIVDYQLSGMNDPCFELGDIAAESDYDPDLVLALASAYFEADLSVALTARVQLSISLSHVLWTLWFSVHHGLFHRPELAFDYWAEARAKWSHAVRCLDSPELGRQLDLAAGRLRPARGGIAFS